MTESVELLLVGVFHFANPGRDMGNVAADDVLAPKRQEEIEAVAAALARFNPTRVAVEFPADRQEELTNFFGEYCNGQMGHVSNEIAQLGCRVARAVGADVLAVDAPDVFYDPECEPFLEQHPELGRYMQDFFAQSERESAEETEFLATHTIGETLRYFNSDEHRRNDLTSYFTHLVPIGLGALDEYPGPDMIGYWYRRNSKIACNLLAAANDGDRILVVFGAGHMPVLEHIFGFLPMTATVPTLDFLP